MNNVDRRAQHTLITLISERERNRLGDSSIGRHHTGDGHELPEGADVEPRVAKLESHFEYIRRDLDSVVTDVREGRREMRHEFKTMRTDMQDEFKSFRTDMQNEFKAVRAEMQSESKAIRADMQSEFKTIRADMQSESKAIRADMQSESKAIRADMQSDSTAVRADMREDFRIMFASLVAVALGMTGLMAKGFGWL